jgi:tetraacyldisaccharide 4''-kinase
MKIGCLPDGLSPLPKNHFAKYSGSLKKFLYLCKILSLLKFCTVLLFLARIIVWPYALILWLRHKCYDLNIIKSESFDFPVLSIGNITVGGTGKTPHTELIIKMYRDEMPVAVLSLGYKRRSKGFRYVQADDNIRNSGDEPLQIKRKFPDIPVAVDANRIEGIRRLKKDHPELRLVILDDAFQYRRLRPTLSLLLSDYTRPYTRDVLLPFGRLRDLPSRALHADLIIVSKSPPNMTPIAGRIKMKEIHPRPYQPLFFTQYVYGAPQPLFPDQAKALSSKPQSKGIALSGIARATAFIEHIQNSYGLQAKLNFPDHHVFSSSDAEKINHIAANHPQSLIYTTEKDATRLRNLPGLSLQARAVLYYIPIEVGFFSPLAQAQFKQILSQRLFCKTSQPQLWHTRRH